MKLHQLLENCAHRLRYRATKPYLASCNTLVDLGCGSSYRFLKESHKMAARCWGLDINVVEKKDGNITLCRADITSPLPFEDETVDIVTCLAVFEHIADYDGLLKECYRILRPEGRIIITTPTRLGIKVHEVLRRFRLVRDVRKDEHKDHSLSKEKLSRRTQVVGFDILAARTFEWGLNILLVATKPK